jgi:lipopolysaccharide/colanic/teichoic acid biosynthesis glycosyltransferase
VGKRLFDVTFVLVTAPAWVPIMLLAALLLAIDLGGNPFFLQQRVGLHGKPFTMYKLRTMRHACPGKEDCYVIDDFRTFVFSPPDKPNPRITRLGAFFRKTSIDELPNLINVLKGEMSLVGPRPEIPEIVAQYPPHYHRRHEVLPGITGLAQLNGRSDLTYDETITYDLAYVDNHSLRGDIAILLKTLLAVLKGSGAR